MNKSVYYFFNEIWLIRYVVLEIIFSFLCIFNLIWDPLYAPHPECTLGLSTYLDILSCSLRTKSFLIKTSRQAAKDCIIAAIGNTYEL